MTGVAAPPLVVWLGAAMYTFGPGRDITVGRGPEADIRVEIAAKQAISRVHVILHADAGQWTAIDKSRNGIYVDGRRAASVPIDDDVRINLGAPDGPPLTFRVTTQQVPIAAGHPAGAPPRTAPPRTAPPPERGGVPRRDAPPPPPRPAPPARPPAPGSGPPSPRATPPRPAPPPPQPRPPQPRQTPTRPPTPAPAHPVPPRSAPPRPAGPPPVVANDRDDDVLARMTGAVKKVLPAKPAGPPPGALTIGRHSTSAVHVDDSLASRTHAYLVPTATAAELYDNASNNGTFVNGVRITAVTLRAGDVVTIGNTDLVYTGGSTLKPRTDTQSTGGVEAHRLSLQIDGHDLLTDVSFAARPGTLTAVIGPSGAGKSTLIKLLGGLSHPSSGTVSFDGHDVHAEYATMRSRIGMVPQDDVVHRQLTVNQALSYAAQLRLPPDTSRADRRAVVDRVLGELELTEHRNKRVDKLSGGQRKRASVALELLTGPSLLILDEPTSGLDPALDRQVMSMLRRLADAGRTVVVVTHSLTYLTMCDQVLLLAPGGKTAYAGPPNGIQAAIGTSDWADIFAWVSTNPDAAHAAFLARNPKVAQSAAATTSAAGPLGEPARASTTRQVATLARRQVRLVFADRGYALFLVLLPFILGALSLVVPGEVGLGEATTTGGSPNEPTQLLILANIAAVFMGTALTIRDLVGERTIFRREQAVGLSSGAYLFAKVAVYSVFAVIQAAIVTAIVVYGKGGPTQGALVLGNPVYDLYLALALTAIVSAVVGLLLSSLARSNEQILPMLVVVIMLSIVFSGGLIPVTGRVGLEQASFFLPARWGFAASASVIDLLKVAPLVTVDDPLWHHALRWYLIDMGVLLLLGIVAAVFVLRRLRLPVQDSAGAGQRVRSGASRVATVVVVVVLAGAFVAGLSQLTKGGGPRATLADNPLANTPTQGAAPPQTAVPAADLPGLLRDAETVASLSKATELASADPRPLTAHRPGTATPPPCAGVATAGAAATYAETTPSGVQGSELTAADTTVFQYVTSYASTEDAARVQDAAINDWRGCADSTITYVAEGRAPVQIAVGKPDSVDGRSTVLLTEPGRSCQHVLATDANVVVDVLVCAPSAGSAADDIAKSITDDIS
ncbi:ABC-type multidrug transport system ATPase subunit [Mycolicibacterium iranicum]|uniref:ABC-type multidrug transport system ATPase subunit n=1 Tax=Mycolicibacterium iranicum TaxID=912594 RepID=A0A839Q712_MYCIR|nr:ATP-binding cassette domain-containing protein [Mycolicibacterium iranicum]MBB2988982.1 ABC-type multidrug transport system ATPase subunit [Mycolicibacterium iranicum]